MTASDLGRRLVELEASRFAFGPGAAVRVVRLLKQLESRDFPDPATLIRFHETLLFLRAFPQGPVVVHATGRVLNAFHKKIAALRKAGADMDAFDTFETSGI